MGTSLAHRRVKRALRSMRGGMDLQLPKSLYWQHIETRTRGHAQRFRGCADKLSMWVVNSDPI